MLANFIRRGVILTSWFGTVSPPIFLDSGGRGSMKDILQEHVVPFALIYLKCLHLALDYAI